ncbi:DUF5103 domain-containing protein [Marinilabiliaceae bacterium ANBcel2]|nr:DUF5103 domain-containing protein [Marinilabiliaceae bacterium ANBcel2]
MKLITLLFFAFFNFLSLSTTLLYSQIEETISPSVKTVQLHPANNIMGYPIINIGKNQTLNLSFDEPGSMVKNYYYSIELYDREWNKSGLIYTDYLNGSQVNEIRDYNYSYNTSFDYIHYNLTIPNSQIQITRSGNYALKIFEDNNRENPVIIKKFYINEEAVSVNAAITNPSSGIVRDSHQQITFDVMHPTFTIHDPLNQVKATIIQNRRKDNRVENLKPYFVRADELDFRYSTETQFEGGNEFRYVDLRSTRFFSDKIENIEFTDPFYHVTLFPEIPRQSRSYRYKEDINGGYIIDVQEGNTPATESDYMFVHFTFKAEEPFLNKNLYINGALTNWKLNKESKMEYNSAKGEYQLSLLLKQGYYNYQYLLKPKEGNKGSLQKTENSFQQTENDYLIIIYYRGSNDICDRIIATKRINSIKR